jgi:hypothetical protein
VGVLTFTGAKNTIIVCAVVSRAPAARHAEPSVAEVLAELAETVVESTVAEVLAEAVVEPAIAGLVARWRWRQSVDASSNYNQNRAHYSQQNALGTPH